MNKKDDKFFRDGDIRLSIGGGKRKKGITICMGYGDASLFLPFRSVADVITGFSDQLDDGDGEVKLRKGTFSNTHVMCANNRMRRLVGYMRGDLQVQFWFSDDEKEARFKRESRRSLGSGKDRKRSHYGLCGSPRKILTKKAALDFSGAAFGKGCLTSLPRSRRC